VQLAPPHDRVTAPEHVHRSNQQGVNPYMKRQRTAAAVAGASILALALTACGGSSGGGSGAGASASGSGGGSAAAFNAAVGKVFNPSDAKGGTLRYANSGDWDSLDPADTYYAYSWNFVRLYGRSLVMFASAPGADGAKLVPDLAQTLGVPSDGAKTWTYKLRTGVKFEDGTAVTSKDVKYAVERSLDKDTFPNGPTYFNDNLDLQGYTSPYKDTSADKLGLKAIETPDAQTIVFHLKQAFAGFDYFAQLPSTIPVPRAKDTGTKYKNHVVSTGPYMFSDYQAGKSFKMVRNPSWDQATDPNRKPLPDTLQVQLNVNADDIDNRLISGDLDVAIEGTGVGPAAQGRILADPAKKANADSAVVARIWFTAVNGDVAPLNNVHCRRAVEYATDKVGYQNAYGGPTGGDIATNLMPPVIPGAESFNPYPPGADNKGDVTKAKDELTQCGQPNGFSTNISYRAERPKEKAVAESLQQSLAKVGIKLTIKPYPLGDYLKLYAGKPAYAKANNLGLMVYGWGADWPDGYGFLSQIVDSRAIHAAGNSNLTVKDPAVDALIDKALTITDTAAREKAWVDVDKKVMDDAYLVPGIWTKGLLYRPTNLTNVFVTDGTQMYDYLALGVKK
jgi:peptide/nickel transport system substrate-binding protein